MRKLLLSAVFAVVACSGRTAIAPVDADSSVVTDDFERAQLGTNWVNFFEPVAGIVDGRDLGALNSGFFSVDWYAPFGVDQFSEIVISAAKNPNMLVQVHVRRQRATLARYGFHYNPERNPPGWEIKYDGVPSAQTRILASMSSASGVKPGDVLRIEARGREISGYYNGQRILWATDDASSAILATGGTGLTARMQAGHTARFPEPIAASWRGGTLK